MCSRSAACRLFTAALLAGRLAAAEPDGRWTEIPLDAASLVIALDNADVEILSDATAAPTLRARTSGDRPTAASLDQRRDGGLLEIRRPLGEDPRAFRIVVEVVVGAEQKVLVEGRDLRVMTRESEYDGVTATPGLHFILEGSELDVEGGRDAVLEVKTTAVWLKRTRGVLRATLESGTFASRDHDGEMKLESYEAEVNLVDHQGNLELRVSGGSVDVRDGVGDAVGRATNAVLLLSGWRGGLVLEGAGYTLEAAGGDHTQRWQLKGTDLHVSLEGLSAQVTAELDGGRFLARSMNGKMMISAIHGADVEITDQAAGLTLNLAAGARARLDNVSAPVLAQLRDATLDADTVERLDVDATGSQVTASQVRRLNKLDVSDSEIDLDLTASRHNASVRLQGTGRARFQLPAPCRVRVQGPQGLMGDSIDVTGCELRLPGQPASSARGRLIYGDRPPVTLNVALGEDVELDVEGL